MHTSEPMAKSAGERAISIIETDPMEGESQEKSCTSTLMMDSPTKSAATGMAPTRTPMEIRASVVRLLIAGGVYASLAYCPLTEPGGGAGVGVGVGVWKGGWPGTSRAASASIWLYNSWGGKGVGVGVAGST